MVIRLISTGSSTVQHPNEQRNDQRQCEHGYGECWANSGLKIGKENQVNGCGATNSLVLSDFQLPLEYDEVGTIFKKICLKMQYLPPSLALLQITFDFTNIGSVLGAAVSLIGSFAIDFGRGLIVDGVKKVLNLNLNTGQVDIDAAGDYGATSEPAVRG